MEDVRNEKHCIAQPEGGVGKTTTTANLGACLAILGKKVLVIDMDPQANLSVHLGIDIHTLKSSVYDILMNTKRRRTCFRPRRFLDWILFRPISTSQGQKSNW